MTLLASSPVMPLIVHVSHNVWQEWRPGPPRATTPLAVYEIWWVSDYGGGEAKGAASTCPSDTDHNSFACVPYLSHPVP